ncbi:MAG: dehydrogenase component, partial [Bacteroidetes bacterium]|nr:dehydrogenase component [Bacteroidota bacterium]
GLDDFGISVHKNTLNRWYQILHMARIIDTKAENYVKQGKGWSYHSSFVGHDGIQLILGLSFRQNKDFLFPYYRDLLTGYAAGITVEEIVMNGISKAGDVASGGRHMSNHIAKPSIRIQNVSSATGNHALHATGVARAAKKYDGDEIAFASFGDSAASEGFVFEAMAGAARERLPVIFVIQNNKYGISVPIAEGSVNPCVADNFSGLLNLRVVKCDGTNVFDSWRGMQEALDYVRSGDGPALLHADCVRINSHSNSDRQDLYRSKEEIEEAKRRDPLVRFRAYLIKEEVFSEAELREIEEANQRQLDEACTKAEASSDPDPRTATQYVVPDEVIPDDVTTELPSNPSLVNQLSLREAINETLKEEFRRNPHTFLWGQDVASKEKGGVFNVTKGMQQEFGSRRVFNAPIAENFIVGTANGFSRYRKDIWVCIEGAQFADYFWPAMEQLIECSHDYYRTNGQFAPNIVIRLASGGYIGGGLYHSQNLEAVFNSLPGLRVVVPAFADDAIGMLRASFRNRGVTLFLEPKFLYNQFFVKSPNPGNIFYIPFGKARVRREGTDLTIVSYGTTVHWALRAASKLADEDVSVEVIDLRSLAPWDKSAVMASVRKTGRLLVVHEDKLTGGFGGEVASYVAEHAFKYLDAPVTRLGSKDTPVPFARILEAVILVQESDVYETARKLASY